MSHLLEKLQEKIDKLEAENKELKALNQSLTESLKQSVPKISRGSVGETYVAFVEDDLDVRELYASSLEDPGYQVLICGDGAALAFQIFKGHVPGAIILDPKMPGLDGLSILKKFRDLKILSEIPIIVVSGFVEDVVVELNTMNVPYLEKPVNPDDIIDFLEKETNAVPSKRAAG